MIQLGVTRIYMFIKKTSDRIVFPIFLKLIENLYSKHVKEINHALFKCSPALQTWTLYSAPMGRNSFPYTSVYTNLDLLFWRNTWRNNQSGDRELPMLL